jgi:hypothetical protein
MNKSEVIKAKYKLIEMTLMLKFIEINDKSML